MCAHTQRYTYEFAVVITVVCDDDGHVSRKVDGTDRVLAVVDVRGVRAALRMCVYIFARMCMCLCMGECMYVPLRRFFASTGASDH